MYESNFSKKISYFEVRGLNERLMTFFGVKLVDSTPIEIQKLLEVKKNFTKIHPPYHFSSSMRPKLLRNSIL